MDFFLGLLTFLSLITGGVALVALVRGRIVKLRIPNRKVAGIVMASSLAVVVLAASLATPSPKPASKESDSKKVAKSSRSVEKNKPILPSGVPQGSQEASIERVVDGDTIWVYVPKAGGPLEDGASHNIRLLEVDTPETQHPTKGLECFGPEASAFTSGRLTVGTTVYLESDEEDKDQFGRFLRYVWLADGSMFNRTLVIEGYARAVLFEPNDRYIELMRNDEAKAKEASKGLWGPPCMGQTVKPEPSPPAPPPPAPAPAPAKPKCDPAYPTVCIAPPPPDLDCGQIAHKNFKTLSPDPHGFDGDKDGIGCEATTTSGGSSGSTSAPPPPPPPPSSNCHASYPDFCVAPPPPDLNCPDMSKKNFTVRWDVADPDPHGFDRDQDGIGCES